ncbi:cation-translocating P-type ATPase [Nonomuraea gerenzanensis]|uniref:Lead, cadmium, zinc and mercury transporting ATPase Copper-translocating P-type ATPase n=1 Tax=Nonomuraea gerenzanensis TaxID=93944 RepID=A0A1M4EGY9_9ACTN|nr:cation-transporting P-type ATPase [Nonomuraea gerenzanensis]UBU09511.1 cation-transporting P-type ATPase [Nonomuraea gerenzanensis]SBO97928.1 Lead, cadmium, zinc and mercury transporting ATPase; Copper-translocating P-type ATPase [Nonomuraea gerenzanensis]
MTTSSAGQGSAHSEPPAYFAMPAVEALKVLGVEAGHGLSAAEVQTRREQYGPNKFAEAKPEPAWRAFVRQYADAMQLVLLVAGIGSLLLQQWGTGIVLLGLTLFNAFLGLRQEGKAAAAVAALQKMMIVKAKVRRDGALAEVAADELVPGDVVSVEAGDLVPADGRIIRAATLEIDESALTGESTPVGKDPAALLSPGAGIGDRITMAFMNTNVTRGSGDFVVTATGMSTEVGHISGMLQTEEETETPLTRQLAALTNQILVISGFALVLSMALNLARGNPFAQVFTASIAFAVAAIPTGLPAVVTTILSMGTQMLAKANAIVKRLRSTETLGCTSAINSDKTGTLTLNQMTAVEMTLPGRRYVISGSGYSTEGTIKRVAGQPDVPLEPFLLPMALTADAEVQDGVLVGDPTEGALVVLAEKGGLDVRGTRAAYPRVAEVPFDAAYKLMATFHRMPDERGSEVIRCLVKGAPDQLLARSDSVLDSGLGPIPVTDDFRARYLEENQRLAEQGLRVMGTARKDFDPAAFDPDGDLLAQVDGLVLLSLVGIVDPPRPQAKAAIAKAREAGIEVRMITGDHAVTAESIARQLGIPGRAITGAEFAAMDDETALREISDIGVIARVAPEHKVRLVDVLRRQDHVVAMTGDGVNDAPALKRADIGIAMGITGTEVSKEAATMILTDDDFSTIVRAVEMGRGLYDNLKKYIKFQIGTLIGFIVTFLGASVFNLVSGVPMLPLQTLWVNFTVQICQAVGLGYGVAAADLMQRRPRPINEQILDRRLFRWLGVAGFVVGVGTLGVVWWGQAQGEDLARTMALTTFALFNLFFSIACRDETRSMFARGGTPDKPFLYASLLSVLAIVLSGGVDFFQRLLGTVDMDLGQWLVCIVVAGVIIPVSEVQKALARRKQRKADEALTGSVA